MLNRSAAWKCGILFSSLFFNGVVDGAQSTGTQKYEPTLSSLNSHPSRNGTPMPNLGFSSIGDSIRCRAGHRFSIPTMTSLRLESCVEKFERLNFSNDQPL
jgi:hypothetical protein